MNRRKLASVRERGVDKSSWGGSDSRLEKKERSMVEENKYVNGIKVLLLKAEGKWPLGTALFQHSLLVGRHHHCNPHSDSPMRFSE
jgi:hypothetical protein